MDQIQLEAASIQEEDVPAKKVTKSGIQPDVETMAIKLDPSDLAKTALVGTELGSK